MSKLIPLVTAVLALTLTQNAAFAADAVPTPEAMQTIELPAHALQMDIETRSKFVGVYELSTGEKLKIVKRGQLMYASLDSDDVLRRVVVAGTNTFVSEDKKLKIHLERNANDDVSGEVLIARSANSLPVLASVH